MIRKFFIFCSIIFLVFASRQNVFAQTTVINNPDSPHELTLQVDKTQAVANGQETITITATLKDKTTFEPLENPTQGTPIANVQLIFEVDGGGVNLNRPSQLTDNNGQIKAYLTATTPGEKTITVTDPSLDSSTYTADYYQVSLGVTFTLAGTPTPLPSPTPTLTPTPSPTPIPTPTPTPWQPSGPVKTDPGSSYFSVEPQMVAIGQTAIIKTTLLDTLGNRVTDEVPYVIVTGQGNTIIQPTLGVNSLAYFSTTIQDIKKVTVKVGNVEIRAANGDYIQVLEAHHGQVINSVDISLSNPPRNKLLINAHTVVPIYFHVPQGRHVDRVIATVNCPGGQSLAVPLTLHSENGGQILGGQLRLDALGVYNQECTLKVTMEPPEEPGEPPIEIPIEPIDPFGVIYDAKTGEMVVGAVVTLYELQNGNWIIWDGSKLQQINPQTTDASGLYSFWVYPGKYYLTVVKKGYDSFVSDVIEVIEEPVKLDVYLNPQSNIKLLLWALTLIAPLGFVVAVVFFWRRKKKKAAPPETQAAQN